MRILQISVAKFYVRNSSYKIGHGALQQKEMNNWIGPTVEQLWKYAMHVLHNFLGVQHKHNSFLFGPIQPSSLTTEELHESANGLKICFQVDVVHSWFSSYQMRSLWQTKMLEGKGSDWHIGKQKNARQLIFTRKAGRCDQMVLQFSLFVHLQP